MEIPETFQGRLEARMKELGVMPADLAGFAGVSISAVLQWLSGQTKNLKMEYLFKVSDALGLEARWLATGEGIKELPKRGARRTPLRHVREGQGRVQNGRTKRAPYK